MPFQQWQFSNTPSRYRFRLVSISCDPNFTFSIDKHTLTIIEVDGISVQPLDVDQIQIFAGQRYSFVVSIHVVAPTGRTLKHLNAAQGQSAC